MGNTAPRMDAAKAWLAPARGHAIVAVAAQEASYPHSKHNLSPKDVTAELSERAGDSTANPEVGGSTPPSRAGTEGKSRGVGWRMTRSKMTRFSGAVAGALAGAVAAGPLAPIGAVAGAAAGYYSSAKVAEEMKVRDHWFDLVKAAVGPEYGTVQTAVLLQMRLIVLARDDVVDLITETRVGYQATGILGTFGNKGGLMVRIELAGGRESMAFVATHLSAHEGEKHVRARNESLARILAGCWDGSLVRRLGEGVVDTGAGSSGSLRDGDDARAVTFGGRGERGASVEDGGTREETRGADGGEDGGTGDGGTGGVVTAVKGADADAEVGGSIPAGAGGRSPTTRSMTARSGERVPSTPNNSNNSSAAVEQPPRRRFASPGSSPARLEISCRRLARRSRRRRR